jgi:luciferase family oxidoreductase group 1
MAGQLGQFSELQLSVVDQAPVRKGDSGGDALREAIALAQAVERLGYRRYWVAEHHNLPSLAATSPEILIGQIAAATERIRVGSGGVMLLHYSALKVAENFHMLESLFPGRIDLGLGRAPGGDQRTASALAYPAGARGAQHYPELVDDLVGFLSGNLPVGHPFRGIQPGPTEGTMPDVWLLGSAIGSAELAADRGLPFSYAHFFGASVEEGPAIVDRYRKNFQPSEFCAEPRVNIAVSVLCAPTQEEVDHHSISLKVSRLNMVRGIRSGILPPEEALAHNFTPEETAFLEQQSFNSIQGPPDRVRDGLYELAERFQTPDLGVVTICYEFAARVRSYELVAEACGIAP